LKLLLLYAQSAANATLSYQNAWPRHFIADPRFECTAVNVSDHRWTAKVGTALTLRTWRGDAIVILHSVFSNGCLLSPREYAAVARLPFPKAFFIGNEFKLMPEKMRFCEDLRVSLLISQSSSPEVHRLYRERLGCAVVGIPHTGLDATVFRATTDPAARSIDLGYRAYPGPEYLGHQERTAIAEYFVDHADRLGLRVDISVNPDDRFDEPAWAAFLNRCKGQVGTEAGGDYFELNDRARLLANDYMAAHPGATFEELDGVISRECADAVPLRIISGRNVEAAGTRSIQILFDGRYDGYFEPDLHYIPLRKDFSNIDDVMRKFRDDAYCRTLVDNAYRVATEQLLYERLIDRFAAALAPLIG
jgi:hypothetical protein